MAQRRTGEIGVYTGKTRSGKTWQLKKRIKKKKRVCVWSVKESIDRYADNWSDSVVVSGLAELRAVLFSDIGKRGGHVVYVPRSMKEFGSWTKLVHAWGIMAPCAAVGEELADVTSAGKAPDGWGNLIRQGAGWGVDIYGVTQRPAESDKTIIGNMSFIHCHQIMRAKDRVYVASEMNVGLEVIEKLTGFKWVERWADNTLKHGK